MSVRLADGECQRQHFKPVRNPDKFVYVKLGHTCLLFLACIAATAHYSQTPIAMCVCPPQ